MPNRLANELSPYLRQHADNPVDWYPWGEEALARARSEDKPILLSIGYSACHWCHVMERESFDDPAIAALMNERFVSIKVDREERPDLDQVYQTAVQLMTRRSGGWPLTVVLTPDLKPFYGGTYFPPEDRHGMPGFPTVLQSVAATYAERRDEVDTMAAEVIDAVRTVQEPNEARDVTGDVAVDAARTLSLRFDARYGGFGDAPKFPNTMSLDVLLRAYRRTGDQAWLSKVQLAVDAMIDGGIHDQLGGGFHRYTTDARWRIPHFEKMLYDNALIARLLTDLWRATQEPRYRETAMRLFGYIDREMSAPAGGFYASQDADSEGREGVFFVWTPAQMREVLGEDDATLATLYYGVDEAGNFEDATTVLHRTRPVSALAEQLHTTEPAITERLRNVQEKLWAVREQRPKPFRDEKVITGWAALMAGAFADAGGAFADARLMARAARALRFLKGEQWSAPTLYRIFKDGSRRVEGFLSDYAEAANASLDLYEASFEWEWAAWARKLVDAAVARFWDEGSGVLYFSEDADDVVVKSEDTVDHAVPSGTSGMVRALLRLEALFHDGPYAGMAERTLKRLSGSVTENPLAHSHMIGSLDAWVHGAAHILLVGEASSQEKLARAARSAFVLDRTLAHVDSAGANVTAVLGEAPARPGAYVCRNRTCIPVVTDAEVLREVLAEG